jgi:hypothetical protein
VDAESDAADGGPAGKESVGWFRNDVGSGTRRVATVPWREDAGAIFPYTRNSLGPDTKAGNVGFDALSTIHLPRLMPNNRRSRAKPCAPRRGRACLKQRQSRAIPV